MGPDPQPRNGACRGRRLDRVGAPPDVQVQAQIGAERRRNDRPVLRSAPMSAFTWRLSKAPCLGVLTTVIWTGLALVAPSAASMVGGQALVIRRVAAPRLASVSSQSHHLEYLVVVGQHPAPVVEEPGPFRQQRQPGLPAR